MLSSFIIVVVLANLLVESDGLSSFRGYPAGKKRNRLPAGPPAFLCPRCRRESKKEFIEIKGVEKSQEGRPPAELENELERAAPGLPGVHCMKGAKGETGQYGHNGTPGTPGQRGGQGTCDRTQIDAVVKPITAKLEALFSSYTTEIARLRNEVHYLKSKFVHTLGSETNPAKSCKEIYEQDRFSPSGAYYLNVTGVPRGITRVYCYMEEREGCPAGSTLVFKIDGSKNTFRYSSPLWSNKDVYNQEDGSSIYDSRETKLPTYWNTAFSKVCLRMRLLDSWHMKTLVIDQSSQSLYNLIADDRFRPTDGGRPTWESLLPGSSLEMGCLREGFNAHGVKPGSAGARIGAIAGDEPDCSSLDSYIGFGIRGGICGVNRNTSCGNEAGCNSFDNGGKPVDAFGYISVF